MEKYQVQDHKCGKKKDDLPLLSICVLIKKSDLKLLRSSHEMREEKKENNGSNQTSLLIFLLNLKVYIYIYVGGCQ